MATTTPAHRPQPLLRLRRRAFGVPGAVAGLIASARAAKRPAWSQAFLADEMLRRGLATSRNQIARLERSEPTLYSYELVAAAGLCLSIDPAAVLAAIAEDYLKVHRDMATRLEMPGF